jgi:hypothetical protein
VNLAALPFLFAVACADPDAVAPGQTGATPLDPGDAGRGRRRRVVLDEPLGRRGIRFDQLAYDVSGNGFHKADTINVAASSAIAVVVGGVPFGTGYTLRSPRRTSSIGWRRARERRRSTSRARRSCRSRSHLSCHELPTAAAAVPVPRWATLTVAALLVTLGMFGSRRRRA